MRALTMIDPATGWFEMVEYQDKHSISIADLFERTWLSRYPCMANRITYDKGSEFIGHEFKCMVKEDYGLKVHRATLPHFLRITTKTKPSNRLEDRSRISFERQAFR